MSQPENEERWLSSKEGAALLGVPRQSFFYYVDTRKVAKREIKDGGKDQYEYSESGLLSIKEEVQRIKSTRKKYGSSKIQLKEPEITELSSKLDSKTDWCTKEDLPYIYALDCEVYGIEYSVPPTKTVLWWEKNKTAIRVLFDAKNRRDIWGCITLLPMKEETIFDLLRGDLSEQQIESDHILTYEPDKDYSCYVASCVVRPDKKPAFAQLLHSVLDYWCNHPEIRIRKLYGFAVGASEDVTEENDGIRLVKKLFFSPRYDIDKNAWELNLDYYNPSPIIQEFQKCIREKRERKL